MNPGSPRKSNPRPEPEKQLAEKFETLLQTTPAAIAYLENEHFRLSFFNAYFEQLAGLSSEQLKDKYFTDLAQGEQKKALTDMLISVYRSGISFSAESYPLRLNNNNTTESYYQVSVQRVCDPSKEINGLVFHAFEVTPRVMALKASEQRENHLQLIADAVPVLISYIDKDGYYRFNNKAYETWFGQTKEEISGKHMREVLGESAYKNLEPHIKKVLAGETVRFRDLIKYTDGDKYIIASYVPHFNKQQEVLGFYVEVTDDTEQQLANKALRESEERFHAAVNAVQGILWTNNARGEMEGEQPGWAALTGQSQEEYQGYGWAKAVHPDDAAASVDAWNEAVRERKTFVFEHRLRTRTGTFRRFAIKAVPLFKADGSIREWVGVHTDVTEQREAEDAIRESEERFRLMADASPVMIWTLNAGGNSTYYNKRALEFTGHTETELKAGQTWQNAIHSEDLDMSNELVGQAIKNRLPYEMECRMRRADGAWRWLLSHGTPRINEKGTLVGYVGSSVDITERKLAEEALRASEDRYQNFIRQSTEGIWRFELSEPLSVHLSRGEQIDHLFKHAYLAECNDAMAQMYGYAHAHELKDFTLADFFPRDADTEAYLNYFIESGYRVENAESKELDRYGEVHYFSNNLVGFIEDGLVHRAWGTQRDITAQKSAEEKLARSEEYFRELTDTVPAIIWITRPDGYCTYLNKNWYEFTGQTPGEAEGFGWLKATHPDDAKQAERLFVEATREHKPFYMLYRLRHKSGLYRWAIDSGHPKFGKDGSFEGMIGTVIDVHEQKLAEDRIKENEEKFRTLAETLPQLVWMTDAKGRLEYASSRWVEYTGMALSESGAWQQIAHPDDLPAVNQALTASVEIGGLYKAETRLKNKNGEYRWHFFHSEPVKDKDGKVSKLIGAFTDVHEEKTITEKLEALVTARTRELKRSNEDLQQFAHVASHDLKEPVRKIKTFAGRLEREDFEKLSDAGKSYLQKMQNAADRMFTMIDGVLTYSTLNAVTQTTEKVNLEKIVLNIKSDLELVIQQKEASIIHDSLPEIEGAEVLLYQLFYNLINNSLKFSRTDQPARIVITAANVKKDSEDFLKIVVRDNGIGFESEHAEKIFGTFERLHAKDKYDGTGLGLALCRKIAERHGGSIKAEGDLEKGSAFVVVLPVKQKENNI